MSSSIFTFYKIVSIDENIKDCYVGKTKNFKNRIIDHKSNCYNQSRKCYNIKLYQFIRENGGINNWKFIEIETNEYDKKDSAFRERYWIEELNATLNSHIPSRTIYEYQKEYCEKNIEKIKKYFDENIEKIKEKRKKYNNKNKEKRKEYREKNKEEIKEKQKEFYDKNKDKYKEYREKNIEKIKENNKKRYEKNKEIIKEKRKEYYYKKKEQTS